MCCTPHHGGEVRTRLSHFFFFFFAGAEDLASSCPSLRCVDARSGLAIPSRCLLFGLFGFPVAGWMWSKLVIMFCRHRSVLLLPILGEVWGSLCVFQVPRSAYLLTLCSFGTSSEASSACLLLQYLAFFVPRVEVAHRTDMPAAPRVLALNWMYAGNGCMPAIVMYVCSLCVARSLRIVWAARRVLAAGCVRAASERLAGKQKGPFRRLQHAEGCIHSFFLGL